jgi:hypothetical protein
MANSAKDVSGITSFNVLLVVLVKFEKKRFGKTHFSGIKLSLHTNAPVVQWIELWFPVPPIGVRIPSGAQHYNRLKLKL